MNKVKTLIEPEPLPPLENTITTFIVPEPLYPEDNFKVHALKNTLPSPSPSTTIEVPVPTQPSIKDNQWIHEEQH